MGFDALSQRIRSRSPRTLLLVAAHERNAINAALRACADGLAAPVLLGDDAAIRRIAAEEGLDLSVAAIEDIPDPEQAALAAMAMVRDGVAGALMKGLISTPDLMRIGLKNGLRREGRLLTHIAVFEHRRMGRLLLLSDSGLVPYPDLGQRVQIIQNAVEAARNLGIAEPRVALLSSNEEVDERIPCSVDAARLKEMNRPGGPLEAAGVLDGPMDLFSAVDAGIAEKKGIKSAVAGRADILHCPDVVSGNLLGKAMVVFSDGVRTGGCVVGGRVPVVLLSRGSSPDDKYCSIVAALACSS